jgi:hypothetical protein
MSQDRRPIDRYLDRLVRVLENSEAAEKAARKERRAQWHAQKEKLQSLDEGLSPALKTTTILNIEPKMHYIALLHDVVFAFKS